MATQTETQIAELQAKLTALQAKKVQEDAAIAAAPAFARELAVTLHTKYCICEHPQGCEWRTVNDFDDPVAADWTEKDHAQWLAIATGIKADMVAVGYTVTDPS